jgi:cytoskeletal protein RodZ
MLRSFEKYHVIWLILLSITSIWHNFYL